MLQRHSPILFLGRRGWGYVFMGVLMLTVSWFSAGVSSAVATKLMIGEIDRIIYTHIEDQHPDTMRFILECEAWFGKPVEILQSPYKSVEGAIMADKMHPSGMYVNGPRGAECTRRLKKAVRKQWEYEQDDSLCYVWGMDCDERESRKAPGHYAESATRFPFD